MATKEDGPNKKMEVLTSMSWCWRCFTLIRCQGKRSKHATPCDYSWRKTKKKTGLCSCTSTEENTGSVQRMSAAVCAWFNSKTNWQWAAGPAYSRLSKSRVRYSEPKSSTASHVFRVTHIDINYHNICTPMYKLLKSVTRICKSVDSMKAWLTNTMWSYPTCGTETCWLNSSPPGVKQSTNRNSQYGGR